jgi:hypothetical protein
MIAIGRNAECGALARLQIQNLLAGALFRPKFRTRNQEPAAG